MGVAYGSDTAKALELLKECCAEHPLVMTDPAPLATFEGFGDSTLNLILRCYLPNLENRLPVTSELHAAIDAKFRAHDIEIAFPQRDLHVRSVPRGLGLPPDPRRRPGPRRPGKRRPGRRRSGTAPARSALRWCGTGRPAASTPATAGRCRREGKPAGREPVARHEPGEWRASGAGREPAGRGRCPARGRCPRRPCRLPAGPPAATFPAPLRWVRRPTTAARGDHGGISSAG